ncbi:MAG: SDR family oxidoreductase [Verrucomicrobia bacterium]|nr:SDR family oxidoreductase [Verrucomicrobiota bacterium]
MNTNPFDLTGQDHWVVGGAGYLGQPIVKLLASLGARVLCIDIEDRAVNFIESAGLASQVTAGRIDANDTEAAQQFVASQLSTRGVPHGLVMMNYASTAKRLEELSAEDFDRVNHGNLTSTFMFARAVATAMRGEKRGSVVLFSSMYGSVAPDPAIYRAPQTPNPIEYGVNKAGIQQMARYLAMHFGPDGVRCNAISPGPFPNPESQRVNTHMIASQNLKVPLARIGQAEEIAGAVAFLVSDASTYVTGINLPVDGGWTAW